MTLYIRIVVLPWLDKGRMLKLARVVICRFTTCFDHSSIARMSTDPLKGFASKLVRNCNSRARAK